jgi:hypothetical protein
MVTIKGQVLFVELNRDTLIRKAVYDTLQAFQVSGYTVYAVDMEQIT